MSTIAIYDSDFFNYKHVIPNLECAKLCTYFHNSKEIATLTPKLNPEQFTRFYIRKDYDDGYFPKEYFNINCNYGGRAFNSNKYITLGNEIEYTIPNMHLYDKYGNYFSNNQTDNQLFSRILNCAHLRLSIDNQTLIDKNRIIKMLSQQKYTNIILHDYNLSLFPEAVQYLLDICNSRNFVTKEGIKQYHIGNKFPIIINNSTQLHQWISLPYITEIFFLQYDGLMSDTDITYLANKYPNILSHMYYNISVSAQDEVDFLLNILPKIFKQVIFLRSNGIKILLKIESNKIKTIELRNFIRLLNCWLGFKKFDNFMPTTQTLYKFCLKNKKLHYSTWSFFTIELTIDEMRDSFQYIRENNFALFDMLYQLDQVQLIGGELK